MEQRRHLIKNSLINLENSKIFEINENNLKFIPLLSFLVAFGFNFFIQWGRFLYPPELNYSIYTHPVSAIGNWELNTKGWIFFSLGFIWLLLFGSYLVYSTAGFLFKRWHDMFHTIYNSKDHNFLLFLSAIVERRGRPFKFDIKHPSKFLNDLEKKIQDDNFKDYVSEINKEITLKLFLYSSIISFSSILIVSIFADGIHHKFLNLVQIGAIHGTFAIVYFTSTAFEIFLLYLLFNEWRKHLSIEHEVRYIKKLDLKYRILIRLIDVIITFSSIVFFSGLIGMFLSYLNGAYGFGIEILWFKFNSWTFWEWHFVVTSSLIISAIPFRIWFEIIIKKRKLLKESIQVSNKI